MQTLRKKTSPCKYKNEPSRFLGDGVSFKAKLIGILEVSEARGDRMCQEALADLKMAIRAAGEHKQRITINIAIDGLRLRDEKTGDSLYHHPVHKISFIAQDMSDSRAFGYIFGSPDTGHRFFGIKTDKAASQVVIAMRDLFQVVFELKKKEIELAKQHIEQKTRFSSSTAATLFSESAVTSNKSYQNGETASKLAVVSENTTSSASSKVTPVSEAASARAAASVSPAAPTATTNESAIADLVDLELELNSIQQGIHQMERITPSDPFGPGSDPFGDSFTSFPHKPFLPPPPPSGGRERQSRTTSDSSSIFSPKTPKIGDVAPQQPSESTLFVKTQSNDDQSSCDWFTPTGGADSLFEDSLESKETDPVTTTTSSGPTTTTTTDASTNASSILSQFDIFTELDPLGTGRSKPYIDKKLFFHELKNPPKKVLKDLLTDLPPLQQFANFDSKPSSTGTAALFHQTDPFAYGDDPFDKTDPFSEDFVVVGGGSGGVVAREQDPFDTDFVGVGDFNKLFHNQKSTSEQPPDNKTTDTKHKYFISSSDDKFKFPPDKLAPLFPSPLAKSPNRNYERQKSPRTTVAQLTKQNTLFDVKFEPDKKQAFSKMNQLHENPSLDMSSESECAPEPPPRPATNITPIKPPPLPPKKQPGDLSIKPPPRPPHTEESHYDYMESYETGLNSMDGFEALETPPLPVPARKSRFDSEFAPQRPKKQFQGSSDEDYLVPNAPPILPPQKKGPILLPPPQKSTKRDRSTNQTNQITNQVTVASFLETKPKLTSTMASEKLNLTPDTLDITLSQLTLSGLNELANKLNIPPSQLSNMTLVQLTSYLSNYVSEKPETNNDATFPTFQADFGANFNDTSASTAKSEPYDRYAVFRELLQQDDTPKTKEAEPPPPVEVMETVAVDVVEEKPVAEAPLAEEEEDEKSENTTFKSTFEDSTADRYAALREIIIEQNVEIKENNVAPAELEEEEDKAEEDEDKKQNDLNQESLKDEVEKLNKEVESNIIDYEARLEPLKDIIKTPNLVKSPVPIAITEIIQNSNHLTSGSVSDVVSGSSPEIDNVGSTSETVTKKNVENTTRESWAIFDTPNHQRALETKEKPPVQSEEGVSPWSSDSKEFGNGSPSDWQQRRDSGSEGDWARRRRDRDGTWWDTQGESGHYEKPTRVGYQRERRSTDSYDDEWYEPDRPPRRRSKQPAGGGGTHTWNKTATGGQSSSSRDVSPWEEEETPRGPGGRNRDWPCRRSRGPSWDRHRRRDDSWDEEDDYEYEDEYMSKFHWPERHGSRDTDRVPRDSDRHSGPRDPPDHWDAGGEQWSEERRHVRRRAHPPQEERWCRPDWDHDPEKVPGPKEKLRYGGSRWPNQDGKWRAEHRKRDSDTRYYKRDHSQESPWEDDYSNDPDEPHSPRYLSAARRTWKRPSSASEMDRKSGEIKQRPPYYLGTGGSDGERTARRTNRRSRSRDSTQFAELPHSGRHKPDTSLTLGRYPHRSRDNKYNQMFENEPKLEVKLDPVKKAATLGRKKSKDLIPKIENDLELRAQLKFENDFVNSETDSPVPMKNNKFNFENDTSEAESPVNRYTKSARENLRHKHGDGDIKPNRQVFKSDLSDRESTSKSVSPLPISLKSQKSLFEDDFSPTDKPPVEGNGITAIAEEETGVEPRVSFTENNLDKVVTGASSNETRKSKLMAKNHHHHRIANNIRGDVNLKKSDSVNIFARANDPFDDDFFSGRDNCEVQSVDNVSPTGAVPAAATATGPSTDFKWTEDFDSFDIVLDEK